MCARFNEAPPAQTTRDRVQRLRCRALFTSELALRMHPPSVPHQQQDCQAREAWHGADRRSWLVQRVVDLAMLWPLSLWRQLSCWIRQQTFTDREGRAGDAGGVTDRHAANGATHRTPFLVRSCCTTLAACALAERCRRKAGFAHLTREDSESCLGRAPERCPTHKAPSPASPRAHRTWTGLERQVSQTTSVRMRSAKKTLCELCTAIPIQALR
jgi:hypothetical protein